MGAFAIQLPGSGVQIGGGNGAGYGFGPWSENVPNGRGDVSIPGIDTQDGFGSLLGSLASTGFKDYLSYRQADLLESQINKGQAPSIVTGPNGAPSAGYSTSKNTLYDKNGNPIGTTETYSGGNVAASTALSSNFILYAIVAVVLIFLLKR